MQVRELCQRLNLNDIQGEAGENFFGEIYDIVQDSRRAGEEKIFLARRGRETDGHKYIADAYRRGSRVFVVEYLPEELQPDAVYIRVANPAGILGLLAAEIFEHPEEKLDIYGITGTNGKTTTSFIIQHLLRGLGVKCGLIGTIQVDTGKELIDTPRTTPESNQIFRYLNLMVEAGCQAAVMEVSSHALSLERVEGLKFRAAIFTNISRDHLDFHADFADYLGAKLSLLDYLAGEEQGTELDRSGKNNSSRGDIRPGENFSGWDIRPGENDGSGSNVRSGDHLKAEVDCDSGEKLSSGGRAYYNIDDNRLRRAFRHFTGPKHSFGIEDKACYRARNISYSSGKLAFELEGKRFESNLTGKFNIYNCLASLAPLLAEGYRPEKLQEALAGFPGVPGRFEEVRIEEEQRRLSDSVFFGKDENFEDDEQKSEEDQELKAGGMENQKAGFAESADSQGKTESSTGEIADRDRAGKADTNSTGEAGGDEIIDEVKVFVDYAHTPAGMENVLRSVQEFHSGRIISVFGCGGDRDKEKRPEMGEIGLKMSDLIFVTSDNPRSEKPEDIIEDILAGVRKLVNRENYPETAYQVVTDREKAIFAAVEAVEPGDIVIIFGKGHETYQEFSDRTIDFDDREVARRALASRKG